MKINILGTGCGMAQNCFNTCFTIEKNGKHFLIDSGGGNTILKNLKLMKINLEDIDSIFISHIHMDHILGCLWIIRSLLPKYYNNYINSPLKIYGNISVINCLKVLVNNLIPKDFLNLIGVKIILSCVHNNDKVLILGNEVIFFDINARKVMQYGFSMNINHEEKFTFIGDEYCSEETKKYIYNSKWLFADAYMCGEEADKYNPMKKHCHSSVKYISKVANELNVKNLILSHTIDNDIESRRERFTDDAKKYFYGNILIPNDLDVIVI